MARPGKTEFEKVLKLIVDSVEKRLSQLPPKQADAARKQIHKMAAEAASISRKNAAKPARARSRRGTSRSRAKLS
ncbi:MAG: hypothetical protein LAO19_18740 [Acidobacteriia bacterium]|nr:hypothetical protein [Terriglobia bacterium]